MATTFRDASAHHRGRAARVRAPRAPRRLPRVSGRAAVLGLLLLGLMLLYVFPLRTYLAQQATIDDMQRHQTAQQAHIDDLTAELDRWNDPDYVAALARQRLGYVHEGDLLYIVTLPDSATGTGTDTPPAPWYSQVMTNLATVDNPVTP